MGLAADELSEEDRAWLTMYAFLKADGKVSMNEESDYFKIENMKPAWIAALWAEHPARLKNRFWNSDNTRKDRYVTADRIFFAKTYTDHDR